MQGLYLERMAIKQIQIVEDDFDGSPAETRQFSLNGVAYEIDLNEDNYTRMTDALAPFVEKARRTRGGRGAPVRRASPSSSPLRGRTTLLSDRGLDAKTIRGWAEANGVEVNDRGRIPDSVVEQFEAAHRPAPAKKAAAKKAAKKAPAKKATARKAPAKKAAEPVLAGADSGD